MSGFDRKIEIWRKMAAVAVANKRSQRTQAAPRAETRKPPTATARTTRITAEFDPSDIDLVHLEYLDLDPRKATAAAIVAAGQRARGKLPIPTPAPVGVAAAVTAAADLARSGGPQRQAPTGLAKQILEAGAKRREPRGG